MTAAEFHLPDLGEGLHEAEILHWHVRPGDHVVENQPLVAVETDKAVVDIPAPRSGRIARLAANAGDRLPVGALLVEFDDDTRPDSGTLVGELPTATRAPAPTATPAPAAGRGRSRAVPAARKLAADSGLDLAGLTGSGPGGVITLEDVRRAAGAEGEWQPLGGVRRSMAEKMARAGREVVPATVTGWADTHAWFGRHPPLLRLVLAVAHACREAPALNCHFDGGRLARRINPAVHLGIAMETADGLLVPVLRDAQALTADAVAGALQALENKAARRQLEPGELQGATISLSNFGAVAGDHAAMVVLPPQVAIVGAGRISQRPWAVAGGVELRPLLPLSVTIDHRAVTGVEAAHFLAALVAHLERADYQITL